MNYQAFTSESLTMMYEGVRGALAVDDALKRQGQETRLRVREAPEWKSTRPLSKPKCLSGNVLRGHQLVGGSRRGCL